jgi:hypothetical protein
MIRYFSSEQRHLLAVELPVETSVSLPSRGNTTSVVIEGTVDVVFWKKMAKCKKVYVLYLDTAPKPKTDFEVARSVDTALRSLLFTKEFGNLIHEFGEGFSKKPRIQFLHVKSGKSQSSIANEDTVESCKSWLQHILRAIKEDIFYPSVSPQCRICPYKSICDPNDCKHSVRQERCRKNLSMTSGP